LKNQRSKPKPNKNRKRLTPRDIGGGGFGKKKILELPMWGGRKNGLELRKKKPMSKRGLWKTLVPNVRSCGQTIVNLPSYLGKKGQGPT